MREERPTLARDLSQADADDLAFNESIKKIAMYKTHLDTDDAEVSAQIEAARNEIRDKRDRSRLTLEEIDRELKEARRRASSALARYHHRAETGSLAAPTGWNL